MLGVINPIESNTYTRETPIIDKVDLGEILTYVNTKPYLSSEIVKKHKLENCLKVDPILEKKIKATETQLETVNKSINVLVAKEDKIFDIEREIYDSTLINLTERKKTLEKEIEEYALFKMYPEIDLSFLRMKKENVCITSNYDKKNSKLSINMLHGDYDTRTKEERKISLPLFVTYSIKSNQFGLTFDTATYFYRDKMYGGISGEVRCAISGPISSSSNLPLCIRNMYKEDKHREVSPNYADFGGNGRTYDFNIFKTEFIPTKIYTKYVGFIPDDIKEHIKEAQRFFGDDIYIITEATKWMIEGELEINLPELKDPIIFGVHRHIENGKKIDRPDDKAFFITAFNCTPSEEYVKNAYVGDKAIQN